ncbi:MAG: hypothetical protein RH859_07875 [Longimicrobiales bacterium]
MSRCTEVYVYEIQPERLNEFLAIKDRLIEEARTLPGLIESATFRSDDAANLFIDRMTWESAAAAREGSALFEELPTSGDFLSMMAGPPRVGGRFTLVAGA